ncbi:GTPase ObgE [Leptolinea tardivitalis]|uniref:GTPase Obg n=2 Tax=Leptolinea tardivitalis TaxID=229920 RepID=A0A0P6WZ41_9CHLR|nr:GTPase ObgE [Leptolinea tardivitalis]GAP20241.1 Obg family GTPase CgtA [Leptolinea tardivitalis]
MVHFHREKFVNRGGPDGGDGGRGGDVILEVRPTMNTLSVFRHQLKYIAQDGKNGGPNNMSGKSAENLVVYVPPGTIVINKETGKVLGDLVESGQQLLIARGGRGGRGNQHFATSRNQAPRTGEKGEPAEEFTIKLELKLIADVGLVGLPNAGKSSFLAAVTNANPKIADYPFTTLEAALGVAQIDEENSLVIADIPGLVEGAHKGVGLGFAFLKHVQRNRVLIHMIDGLAEDPLADYTQINNELALFDPKLGSKPQVVVINKIDLPDVKNRLPAIRASFKKAGIQVMTISALARTHVVDVLKKVQELLQQTPEPEPLGLETELPVYRPEENRYEFSIERIPEGWRVSGKGIERAAAMTLWEHEGSVRRFQHLMEKIGLDDALRDAGVEEGDTVFIADFELEWMD